MPKRKPRKNIILMVGMVSSAVARTLVDLKKNKDKDSNYRLALIHNVKNPTAKEKEAMNYFDILINCNFDSPKSITQALLPHKDELLAVTCRSEAKIPLFQKIIPHVPYLRTPTVASLEWAINKAWMRRRFAAYDRKITPRFLVVKDSTKSTLKDIEHKIGFPLVIKPTGLAQSMLVSIGYHKEELEKSLRQIFRKINKAYRDFKRLNTPEVVVEQFLEGSMYSIDAYVNSRGKVYFAPIVAVKTGRDIGFDDFFAYQTITPTLLKKQSVTEAQEVSTKALHALGLRSSTAHIELIRTENGWKVIEVGPRVGGFRDKMYRLSYGINHTANDISIRIPRQPKLPKRVRGYTAVLKFFAKKEGRIKTLTGIKKTQLLKSFHSLESHKKVGDKAIFAKHGGRSVFNVTLFNKSRSKLLADIRRLEQMVKIETK